MFLFRFTVSFFILTIALSAFAQDWQELKDKHFVVFYSLKEDSQAVQRVIRRAEEYYDKIAYQIGYARYSNFWTWKERVKIIIFPDQQSFVRSTGQPPWSKGYADRDSQLFKSRIIVTFQQEHEFLEGVLPHEIGHLILRDFIGFDREIPLWFEEGVAQLHEANKKLMVDQFMRPLIKKNQHIPFDVFVRLDIRSVEKSRQANVFYAQSVSVINFLIKRFGSEAFGRLCRHLKDGKDMDEALRISFARSIHSTKDLEKEWIGYLSGKK